MPVMTHSLWSLSHSRIHEDMVSHLTDALVGNLFQPGRAAGVAMSG
jgi:hypothetical protein